MAKTRRQQGKAHRVVSKILMVSGAGLILLAGGLYAYQRYAYYLQDQLNTRLAAYVTNAEQNSNETTDDAICPVTVDWEGLEAVNDDVTGWLYIPGTSVNYAVYQGDNNERYLRHNAEGTWTIGGQLFLDCDNTAPGLLDGQSIIYGHHLQDGTMFQDVSDFCEQAYFDKHEVVWYITKQKAIRLVPIFFYDTDRDDTKATTLRFGSATELRAFLSERLQGARTQREDAARIIDDTSHVLTLSTCVYDDSYAKGHGRGLLVCVPAEEVAAAIGA